jgi:hypothetical protein
MTLQGHTLRVLLKQSDGSWKDQGSRIRSASVSGPQEAKK